MRRHGTMLRTGTAAVLGLSFIAAACGGSGGDSSGGDQVVDKSAIKDAINATTVPGASTTVLQPEPKSMDEWEKLWANQRAAIIKRIKDNKWGLSADGKTITGPEGFTVDTTKCVNNWSNTQGIENGTIKISQAMAQSGTYADYGNIGKGIATVFKYYNDKDVFKDANGKPLKVD